MNRRTALQKLALLLGGIALTPELMAGIAARAASGELPAGFNAAQLELLAEMADTILPDTDTPGAKAANAHQFIALLMEDCMPPETAKVFWMALDATNAECIKQYGKSFVDCNSDQRIAFFTKVEAQSKTQPDPNFWRMLKGMTLFAYFTSEIGMTQALAYDPIPGGWIPEMKIDENTKAWAGMF